MPSGNWAPTPANTEAVRESSGIGSGPSERTPLFTRRRFYDPLGDLGPRNSQLPAGVWGSCRPQLGMQRSEPNRKRLSVSKGTWEAQSRKVIARIDCRKAVESSPMRRLSGGASVVVGGRESRPQGEGRQDVSCWATEGFNNREGSR